MMNNPGFNSLTQSSDSYFQHTLQQSFTCIGRGLHTGFNIILRVMPAEVNSGYLFIRRDLPPGRNEIRANWHTVSDTHLSTTVQNKHGCRVSTIEHLISALHACGIDNATIVLDGPEVPVMDGSAKTFVELIENAGLQQQSAERKLIRIKKPVSVTEGNTTASLSPCNIPLFELTIDFESSIIGRQHFAFELGKDSYADMIASARTFGFKEQVNTLQKLGFARGGSLQNAILIDGDDVINQQGLRFQDEFVRHKLLDSIGDLALAGGIILGHYLGDRPGHAVNNLLLRELMSDSANYEYRTVRQIEASRLPNISYKGPRKSVYAKSPSEMLQD